MFEQGHAADTLLDGERLSTAGRSMIRLLDQTEEQAAPDASYIDFAMQ